MSRHLYSNVKIDINSPIGDSKYFKWYEVLLLREINIYAFPTYEQMENLIEVISAMDEIRKNFAAPITVTSALRPDWYNTKIRGAANSAHKYGMAIDFVIRGYSGGNGCDEVRMLLRPELDSLGIRMEDLPRSNWVHIDTRDPGKLGKRYFKP